LVERLTLGFGPGHGLAVEPRVGLRAQRIVYFRFSLPLPLPLPLMISLSKIINKSLKKSKAKTGIVR